MILANFIRLFYRLYRTLNFSQLCASVLKPRKTVAARKDGSVDYKLKTAVMLSGS